tara:strand:+ start:735 stop:1115 length:381 start_codon:yes stop_codon:yes gene_type:complete
MPFYKSSSYFRLAKTIIAAKAGQGRLPSLVRENKDVIAKLHGKTSFSLRYYLSTKGLKQRLTVHIEQKKWAVYRSSKPALPRCLGLGVNFANQVAQRALSHPAFSHYFLTKRIPPSSIRISLLLYN